VSVVLVTDAHPPRWPVGLGEMGLREARKAHKLLGVERTIELGFNIAELDQTPHADVNARLTEAFTELRPTTVLLPFGGDLMLDHQLVQLSAIVAARPIWAGAPTGVYAYETLSQTNWNAPYAPRFAATAYVDITDHLEDKIAAMAIFESQLRTFPHERSLDALRAQATLRGAQFGCPAAEAFVTLRQRLD
jgi:LmbE family N-acetylglucosaminyl deacetylase